MLVHMKRSVGEVLYILMGTCLAVFAIAAFILLAKIASGGVNYIATIPLFCLDCLSLANATVSRA